MSKKAKYIFPAIVLIFTFAEIILIKNRQFQLGILLYLVTVISLYLIDKKYIISFFVFHLPILPIISTDYKILSLIGPHEIIYGFAFIVLLQLSKNKNKKLNKYQKLSISFIYFLFFLNIYILIKDIVLDHDVDKTRGGVYIFKHIFRDILYYYSLILLVRIIYQKDIIKYVIIGIKYLSVYLVLSMLFSEQLILMGANIYRKEAFLSYLAKQRHIRYVGFYGAGGDENSVGIFFVGLFGFLLALFEKEKNIKKYVVFIGAAVLGILLSGSRTSTLALTLILLFFLLFNKSISLKFYIFIAFVSFYFIFSVQIDLIIERWLDPSAAGAIDPKSDGRIWKWIYYTNWILNNPETLFYGNQEVIDIPKNRAPHNYFIYILYHAGIIPLFIFIKLFIKLIKAVTLNINLRTLRSFYYIIPFPFILMTVNSFGSSIYLWLFIPIGAYFISDDSKNHFKNKQLRK